MKGNVLVGQSGGPTSVINSSLCGVVTGALTSSEMPAVYGMRYGIEGFMQGEMVYFNDIKKDIIEGLRQTPGSALGSSRYKLKDDDLPMIRDLLEKHHIRYLFLIGGNDTMDTIHRIEAYCAGTGYELRGIGVPKTVDNDLYGTDHTPGFASAARYMALSVQQAGRLAGDMQRVDRFVVFQTIGRDAGWLAAASALAKQREQDAPHLVYMPERPLDRGRVLADAIGTIEKYGWCFIVIGEGVTWQDGTPVSASSARDNFSNIEFGAMGGASAALNLHSLLAAETGYRGEFQVTESLPMCAIDRASSIDLEEAYACGEEAVKLALEGTSGVMVSIERVSSSPYGVRYGHVPLKEVAVRAKPMPDSYINPEGNHVTGEFIEYASPLVGSFATYSIL